MLENHSRDLCEHLVLSFVVRYFGGSGGCREVGRRGRNRTASHEEADLILALMYLSQAASFPRWRARTFELVIMPAAMPAENLLELNSVRESPPLRNILAPDTCVHKLSASRTLDSPRAQRVLSYVQPHVHCTARMQSSSPLNP